MPRACEFFFERNMFANLAAKVCQIVRNGKGREKQSAPRCVRSCEMVKGKQQTIKRQKKKSRAPSLVGRDTWMAKRAPCALSTLKHPEGESMQHRSAIFPRQHGSASLAGWMSTSQTCTVVRCDFPSPHLFLPLRRDWFPVPKRRHNRNQEPR